jgi:sirohydrochlorin cobaltochelatase
MAHGMFSDAALVLVGHGSTLNADSAAPTLRHGAELRRRGLFAQVLEAFWKEHPLLSGVRRGVFAPRVFVAPVFISDGYFTEEVIPREMGFPAPATPGGRRTMRIGTQEWRYCGPVGTHPGMTAVILSRVSEVLAAAPRPDSAVVRPQDVSLFIAGHGTGNNENSRAAIERQAETIRKAGGHRDVHAVFMEEDPKIEQCYELAETENVVVAPYFISDGLHSREDIPVLLGESAAEVKRRLARGEPTFPSPVRRRNKWVWYARGVGDAPTLADVILERVREAA